MASQAVREGLRTALPLLLGFVPFGMAAGVATVDQGFGFSGAVGSSLLIYAGAAQLTLVDLLGGGAPVHLAVGAALLLNARMLMYSTALTPLLSDQPLKRRALGAYLLTDPGYALSAIRARRGPDSTEGHWGYYLTVGGLLWLGWQIGTILGALVGDHLPEFVPVSFVLPLIFIALLSMTVTDRPTVVAAATSSIVVIVGWRLPGGVGMLAGAIAGITAGTVTALRQHR